MSFQPIYGKYLASGQPPILDRYLALQSAMWPPIPDSPTGIFSCLLRRFSRAPQSTNLCFEARTRPAAAAAEDFCGGLLNRLTGSRWDHGGGVDRISPLQRIVSRQYLALGVARRATALTALTWCARLDSNATVSVCHPLRPCTGRSARSPTASPIAHPQKSAELRARHSSFNQRSDGSTSRWYRAAHCRTTGCSRANNRRAASSTMDSGGSCGQPGTSVRELCQRGGVHMSARRVRGEIILLIDHNKN
jgi:hypothetical protein